MGWVKRLFGKRGAVPPEAGLATGPPDPLGRALAQVYGEQVPFHLGASIAFADGGPDPLDGVSIYWHETGPHWHYVSFGLAGVMGAELTFRHAACPEDVGTEPGAFLGAIAYNAPTWPVQLLNMLARRVHRTGRPFDVGHWWAGPPGVLRPHTGLHHLAFAPDPALGTIAMGGREVRFLQAVGVTAETVAAMQADEREGRGDATLEALLAADPLLVTAPAAFD